MTDIWISDSKGRVLGPVGVEVIRDLAERGRLSDVKQASRDGKSWQDALLFPELKTYLRPGGTGGDSATQVEQTTKAKEQLALYKSQPPHAVFGLTERANLEEYRVAFFALVKKFHPARLPESASPELKAANREIFDHLGKLMQEVERRFPAPTRPSSPGVASPSSAPKGTPSPLMGGSRPTPSPFRTAAAPTYRLEDFVGWASGTANPEANIKVTRQNAGIFTDHNLANLNLNGVFVPSERPYPLGTSLKLHFTFEGLDRQIHSTGKVILENAGALKKIVTGMGVRLTDLSADDKQFIQTFLNAIPPEARQFLRF